MEFPHKAPKGYEYWTDQYSKTVTRIWIQNKSMEFVGCSDVHPSSVWGFYDQKKKVFKAPIHKDKPGKVVAPEDTTPYSAMQLKLNPLMAAFG